MEPPTDPTETPSKTQSVNKLFQGVRKLRADWTSNMHIPKSLGSRSSNTVENTVNNSTISENEQQREGMHKEEKERGSISSMDREELLGVCMKLVKRHKSLEERHSQMLEMHKFVVEERAELLLLAKEVAGLPPSAPETDVASLRAAWLKNREGAVMSDGQNADNKGNEAKAIDSQAPRGVSSPSQLEEDIKTLKQELASRMSSYSQLEEENKRFKQELASRMSLYSELEEEGNALKQELASRTLPNSQLEEDIRTLKNVLSTRTDAHSEREEEISMLKTELEASRASLPSELEEDIKVLKQELQSSCSSYSKLEEENRGLKQELVSRASVSQLEEEINMLKQELSSRTSSNSQLEEEISTLKKEMASRTSFNSQLEGENKTLKRDLEQSRGMYMETISAAEANASKANEDIKKRLAIQEQYEEQISRLQQQVCNTKKERDKAMEEVQTTKRTSENLLAGLEASRISIAESENTEILELRDNIKASQEETARLTALLDDEESKISDTKRMLEMKSGQFAHSAALVQRLRTEMQSAEQRHAERIAVLSSRLAETEKSKENAQKLRDVQVEEAKENTKKLREDNKVTDVRLKEVMVRTEQAEAQVAALMSELVAAKQKEAQGASDTQQCTELRTELQAVKASGTAELASLSAEALKKSKVARTLLDEKDKQLEVAKEIMDDLRRELAQATASERSRQVPLNIEYLRNVMLRYMSFGASSMERKRLLPVICTLLDFSEEDVRRLLKGLKWEWWGGTEMMKSTKNIKPAEPSHTHRQRSRSFGNVERPLLDQRNGFD